MKKGRKEGDKIAKRNKTKEITKTILSIGAVGGVAILAGSAIRTPEQAEKIVKGLAKYSSGRINECLKRLSMQNYIKYDAKDLTKPIFITEKGLERLSFITLKDKIKSLSMKKWDHIWRLVTFDVDEKNRRKRDAFRYILKTLNFYQLQKNIFVIPFSIEDEVEDYARQYKLHNKVLILHVASLGKAEEEIRQHFFKK